MTNRPNHALQRTGSAVTAPAADHRHLSTHRQVPRPLRLSLSFESLGVATRRMMKIVLLLVCVGGSFSFAADSNDPKEIFTSAYYAWTEAEKFERSNSTAAAIERYQEADRLLKIILEKHPKWNRPIVNHRVGRGAEALKRLASESKGSKSD